MWRFWSNSLSIWVCLSCLITHCLSTCPTDLLDFGENICILGVKRSMTYCEAHRTCERKGKQRGLHLFVPGRNIAKICNQLGNDVSLPTSITALFNRSMENLYAGWRVGDPGHASFVTTGPSSLDNWSTVQMQNIDQPHVMCSDEELKVASANRSYDGTLCELSQKSTRNNMDRFEKDWPYPISELFVPNINIRQCFLEFPGSTLLECGKRCRLHSYCRTLYFNAQSAHCVLALYVDSPMPKIFRDTKGTWVRFARPSW